MVGGTQRRLNRRATASRLLPTLETNPQVNADSAVSGADPAILAEITAGLAAGQELRELLERFLEPVVRMAQAQGGAVRMLSLAGEGFELVSSIGLAPDVEKQEHWVSSHCGFCGVASDEARPVWSTDLAPCARRSRGAYFGRECRGALAVPLQHRGRVLGVYNLFFEDAREPGPTVAPLLRSVGDLLGLALDHLRLEAEHMRVTVTQERQRMAGEVHDALAQNLAFVKLRLPLLRDAIETHHEQDAMRYLDEVRDTVGDAHSSLREIITHFRTRGEAGTLNTALDSLAARFAVRTGIPLQLINKIPQLRLNSEAEADVYYIVQEALANVEHHARARQGWLCIAPVPGGAEIRVEDDGIGPPAGAAASPGHHGVEIMHERARRLGGELTLGARRAGGTVVRLVLPVAETEGGAA